MSFRVLLPIFLAITTLTHAAVEVDIERFGASLGGWNCKRGKATEYQISGASYRTYKPEISPSPDGGIFVSVRIDHLRGFFASDDHASLEMSFSSSGALVSAQSNMALQGRTISSELIRGTASAGASVAAPYGVDHAVRIGTDLVADLSSKLLREKIVEPGRVSFPAAIRHNYNQLFQAVKKRKTEARPAAPTAKPPVAPGTVPQPKPKPAPIPLPDIRPYQPGFIPPQSPLPVPVAPPVQPQAVPPQAVSPQVPSQPEGPPRP
ncbi:MAG: hypothetical protein IPK32_26110 [Verrucomicrobiaceae bacterium]|nr:hypothetical protein [Verrucomicrobiaceae bacterium]